MELMSLKKGKEETIKDFVKRYRKTSLELDALNHLQALNGLIQARQRSSKSTTK